MRHAYADPARDPPRQRDIPPQTACAGGQPMSAERLSRRAVLAGAGALVVSFSLLPRALLAQAHGGPKLPGSLEKSPMLHAWRRSDPDGKITIFTGKAELGQGIKTALIQLAAEELVVAPEAIHLVTADTALTPDEGYTAGSHSMQDSGMAIRHAAAQAREVLIGAAAARWQVPPERLQAKDGAVVADDGRRAGYGELVSSELLHVRAKPDVKPVAPTQHRIVGRSLARVDIPAKVAGGEAYVQDLRFADMVHGRVVRPPSSGAKLRGIDLGAVRNVAGLLSTVSQWEERPTLPEPAELFDWLAAEPSQPVPVRDDLGEMPSDARLIEASYHREYQMHGSIGPSCAIGLFKGGALTVWTHSQGVYPLRGAIAQLTQLPPDKVRCIQVEGSGCYGHNGADDAGADAALLAMAVPGRPVRVQWMREDEHAWEPYGSPMITTARAALGPDGRIQAWDYSVRSCVHATRPGPAGNLMPAWHRAQPLAQPVPKPLPLPEGGGHRNAAPLYTIPNARVVYEFVPVMPLRVSALRSLGAYMNVLSIASFMDELDSAANAVPVELRLRALVPERRAGAIT